MFKVSMTKGISYYKSITRRIGTTFSKLHNMSFSGKTNLAPLERDTVTLSNKAKTTPKLSDKPCIIIGKIDSGVKDDRFNLFAAEYRAYDYPGRNSKYPANYLFVDSLGDTRLKPHIYLNLVEVKPEYARQGAYSEAIKKLIEASKREGCEGRITLDSMVMEYEGMTKIPSPSLAHWRVGFRFAEPESNKIMEKVLKGEFPPEQAPTGSMYLDLN